MRRFYLRAAHWFYRLVRAKYPAAGHAVLTWRKLQAAGRDQIQLRYPDRFMTLRNHSVTLQQASQDSPVLMRLTELARDSVARLAAIQSLIPAPLRSSIKAGPIEGVTWCLLLDNNAAAAKIRQLLPALQAHLRTKGWAVDSIRLKVQQQSVK